MKDTNLNAELTPTERISDYIAELGGWRAQMFTRLRKLILEAAPGMTEEWKWGTAVWAQKGNVMAVGAFKEHLKINFFKGASLEDPNRLFNTGLDAKTMRSIDLR